ncbi:hypothetical protein ACJX0J_008540 [Zea mays]
MRPKKIKSASTTATEKRTCITKKEKNVWEEEEEEQKSRETRSFFLWLASLFTHAKPVGDSENKGNRLIIDPLPRQNIFGIIKNQISEIILKRHCIIVASEAHEHNRGCLLFGTGTLILRKKYRIYTNRIVVYFLILTIQNGGC